MSSWEMEATEGRGSGDGGEYPVPPEGAHPAVLVGLIDLGTQRIEYQGNSNDLKRVYLVWELVNEKFPDLKRNFTIARDFTASLTPKSLLRQWLSTWRGKPIEDHEKFDLGRILGKPCLLTVVHKVSQGGNTYAKVDGISGLPRGFSVPPATITPILWRISQGKPYPNYEWIPYLIGENIVEVIARAKEVAGASAPAPAPAQQPAPVGAGNPDANDSTPF